VEENITQEKDPVSTRSLSVTNSFTNSLNRKSRRRLAQELLESNRKCMHIISDNSCVTLKRRQARPPGCAFLGAKAITTPVQLIQENLTPLELVIDSGSDITLISEQCLNQLPSPPKVRTGQKINLIQLTGAATISGFVNLPIFFTTAHGPVRMEVEAYVVKGMTTPLILGNDFADQYDLSLLRQEGTTRLLLGDSGRSVYVENSTTPFLDSNGKHFKVRVNQEPDSKCYRTIAHKRRQRLRRIQRKQASDPYVRAAHNVTIPPESVKNVRIATSNLKDREHHYAERLLNISKDPEDLYGPPDSLISKENPFLAVANFSKRPITVPVGQALAVKRDPSKWLRNKKNITPALQEDMDKRVCLIKAFAKTLGKEKSSEDHPGEDPLDGGPKTAEPAPAPQKNVSLSEIDISPDLTTVQVNALKKVVKDNKDAFGLGNRLGQYPAKVKIRLKEGTEPVSLPPFPVSPAKREVMDKQIDDWIQLEVIEPSVSPWGAPAFIVYRNDKPRMVIDYRKLNDCVIPDEFPLPKQDDILQALTGAQWLSTFDALAGFTQLEMADESKEITAFRSHRGLYQFKRLPFGYRNGPSVFQRVMQGILSAYLWIFTLVYIDDIVVYSKTFEEHLKHIDLVLKAISKAGITLSPAKCHLGYQSLQLLGQQVSRLGLATHQEKIKAISQLAEPRNVHELLTFLGMMTYFSAYIPFYAWIVAPLFKLLRKNTPWSWGNIEREAFELSKEVLISAPIRAYAIPGRGYRLYSDACDYGLAAILQQVQPITIKDLKGTRAYERLRKAYDNGDPIPNLVIEIAKDGTDLQGQDKEWAENFEDTTVCIERVIAYWSRTLKPAEQNYSPTEREALALKEGLIKFQSYIEGERIDAITDHAALTWSKTFQNVNRRLLSWGTTFAAYPNLHIVHRAGRVHSNVDPISRLRRRVPYQEGPNRTLREENSPNIKTEVEDPLKNIYDHLGDQLEAKVLHLASEFQHEEEKCDNSWNTTTYLEDPEDTPTSLSIEIPYVTSRNFSITIHSDPDEIAEWVKGYQADSYFKKVLDTLKEETNYLNPKYPQYFTSDEGLLYFEDWEGNNRLCVPASLQSQIMKEDHETITEGAHCGYHKTFNRLASMYFWPRMSKDIREFVTTCDICQKSKIKRHAPIGMLNPIPIPSSPFEVISMDFIPELPKTKSGYDNILVVVDKLTKYAIFIPTITTLKETECAKLLFDHVFTKFGLPRQIISDRDSKWTGSFWEEVCKLFQIKRALTTSYHPQADGQTEIMNQTLETALRIYVSPQRDDWEHYLAGFGLSYNSTPHTATGLAPSFLLYGYHPRSGATRHLPASATVERNGLTDEPSPSGLTGNSFPSAQDKAPPSTNPTTDSGSTNLSLKSGSTNLSLNPAALNANHSAAYDILESFEAIRTQAKDVLVFAQASQRRVYNQGRLILEFEPGDKVLINRHSLKLLGSEKGAGQKLLKRYDGPFEIMDKLSAITYRLRLPGSYRIHPIINIAHLEPYHQSPPKFGFRKTIPFQRAQASDREWEVDSIVAEKTRKVGNRKVPLYRVRYSGFGPEDDEWIPKSYLKNAPGVLRDWIIRSSGARTHD
jgi:hypothetical protein